MAKFLVTRTVTQEIIVEGVSNEKTAADRANGLLSSLVKNAPYDSIKVFDEVLISLDVLPFAGGDVAARVKQLAAGASEDRFTQLSDHEVK
jgi:hypothetical protein